MIEIKDLLGRWGDIIASEESKTDSVTNVLEKVIGIKIPKENIKIQNNTIYLDIKPIYKNEIFLNKEKITSMLEEVLGNKSPKDIR